VTGLVVEVGSLRGTGAERLAKGLVSGPVVGWT